MEQEELFKHATRFYILMEQLKTIMQGPFAFNDPTLSEKCPQQGIYFLFERTEILQTTPPLFRIVHIGTQGTTVNPQRTLWAKLSQHRGVLETKAGNHRLSPIRMHVGLALIRENGYEVPTWQDKDKSLAMEVRQQEAFLEQQVSEYIQNMFVLWLPLEDTPERSLKAERIFMETNFLSLLCNYGFVNFHPPSEGWLGWRCHKNRVASTGMWSPPYSEILFIPDTLNLLEIYIRNLIIKYNKTHH